MIAQRYDPAVPIEQLAEHPENPRRGNEQALAASMEHHGFYGAVLAQQSSGRIIAGNHRTRVARQRGEETVPVLWLDVDDDQARRLLLVDNRINDLAGYDDSALASILAELEGDLGGTGYADVDLAALIASLGGGERGDAEPEPPTRLAERFLAPPFSVLDSRAGYWRARKERWIRWGLRSEEGRETNLLSFSEAARQGQWAGTSIFDPVLAEIAYSWWCPPFGRVGDPFCGGSVRGAVASALGHPYTGYDLRAEQLEANERQRADLRLADPQPAWRLGDARMAQWEEPLDFVFTCPPYWSLERYGELPEDLSNATDIHAFAGGLDACLAPALDALRADSFAVIVIGAMRQGHRLIDLPAMTAEILERRGLMLYADLVLLTSLASAGLRADRIFATRKPVPVHQRVIVACKGDPIAAAERCGEVEVQTDEILLASWIERDD